MNLIDLTCPRAIAGVIRLSPVGKPFNIAPEVLYSVRKELKRDRKHRFSFDNFNNLNLIWRTA